MKAPRRISACHQIPSEASSPVPRYRSCSASSPSLPNLRTPHSSKSQPLIATHRRPLPRPTEYDQDGLNLRRLSTTSAHGGMRLETTSKTPTDILPPWTSFESPWTGLKMSRPQELHLNNNKFECVASSVVCVLLLVTLLLPTYDSAKCLFEILEKMDAKSITTVILSTVK